MVRNARNEISILNKNNTMRLTSKNYYGHEYENSQKQDMIIIDDEKAPATFIKGVLQG